MNHPATGPAGTPALTPPAGLAVRALAGQDAYEWTFQGECLFDLGSDSAVVQLDGFPGYAHDPDLVYEVAARVLEVWPAGSELVYWCPDRESLYRTNAFAQRLFSGRTSWTAHIVLSGKRTPLHPAVTRFLVAHELGHHVEWWIERARGYEEGEVRLEYAALRGIEPRRASGGRWHDAIGEIFADDFRLLIAGIEMEHWPHPGIDRPGAAEAAWWADAHAEWLRHMDAEVEVAREAPPRSVPAPGGRPRGEADPRRLGRPPARDRARPWPPALAPLVGPHPPRRQPLGLVGALLHRHPRDPPGRHRRTHRGARVSDLTDAIDHYLAAEADLAAATTASADAMRTHFAQKARSTYRAWEKAIDASTAARNARRRARSQLVAAALATQHPGDPMTATSTTTPPPSPTAWSICDKAHLDEAMADQWRQRWPVGHPERLADWKRTELEPWATVARYLETGHGR